MSLGDSGQGRGRKLSPALSHRLTSSSHQSQEKNGTHPGTWTHGSTREGARVLLLSATWGWWQWPQAACFLSGIPVTCDADTCATACMRHQMHVDPVKSPRHHLTWLRCVCALMIKLVVE